MATQSVESPPVRVRRSSQPPNVDLQRSLIGLAALGVTCIVFANQMTDFLVRLLPGRMRLRSLGTNLESFDEIGADIITRTGLVLVAACVCTAIYEQLQSRGLELRIADKRVHLAITTAMVVVTALWYGWLGTPHNAFPSNARFHWVDYITWDTDDYFYSLGRIPHRIFYDAPWMWQSINAAMAVSLCYLIARRMRIGRGLSTALASVIAISGNLLIFANTAEDVLLNVTLVLLLLYATLRRIGWFVGLALLLLILGRPSFAIIALAIPTAELVVALRHRERPSRQQLMFVLSAAVVVALGVLVTQIYFTIAGRRYFLTEGRLVFVPELEGLEQRGVDGFTLSAWSGAYASHLLWVIPIFVLLGAVGALITANRREREVESTVYVAGSSVVLLIVVLEGNPLLYYNIRYLTYLFPLLLVAAWSLLAGDAPLPSPASDEPGRTSPAVAGYRSLMAALLILSPLVFPADPVGIKRAIEERPEQELLAVSDDLRELAGDRNVYLEFGATSTRNFLAYVLRDNPARIGLPGSERPSPGLVIARREEVPAGTETLLETDSFVVFDSER